MYTNKTNLPLPMAIWLAHDEYMYAKTSNELSTTTLLKSPRHIIATRRAMYPEQFPAYLKGETVAVDVDVSDMIAARFGTAIHSAVENSIKNGSKQALAALRTPLSQASKLVVNPDPNNVPEGSIPIYLEQRAWKEVGKFNISGQFDIVFNGQVQDIKTTGTYSWTSGINDDKYIKQLSIYRWLNPELITQDTCRINFVFTNWNQHLAFNSDDYPQYRVMSKELPLMSLQETDLFVRHKLAILEQYWFSPLEEIPCCTEEELMHGVKVTYKYYKSGYVQGKRSTKNFDCIADAEQYKMQQGGQGEIVTQVGKLNYCPYCQPSEPTPLSFESKHKLEIV